MACFDWMLAAARASMSKRLLASWLLAYSASMNLMAQGVPSDVWRPSYTDPMPPRPMSPRSSYFPPTRVLGGGLWVSSLDMLRRKPFRPLHPIFPTHKVQRRAESVQRRLTRALSPHHFGRITLPHIVVPYPACLSCPEPPPSRTLARTLARTL